MTDIVKEEGEVITLASKLPTQISEFVFLSQEILAQQNQNGTAKLSENEEAKVNDDLSTDLDE